MQYSKPWLSVDQQVDRLLERGLAIPDRELAHHLLRTVGYYRLTGYLYPFRESETTTSEEGQQFTRVLDMYPKGTSLDQAVRLIDFDRDLRLLVLEAVERIETALRSTIGYTIGAVSAFAHMEPSTFTAAFTERQSSLDATEVGLSEHEVWMQRVQQRQDGSDEAFVAHFRAKYDNRLPVWATAELLELGQLSRLYAGLVNSLGTSIANEFDVPTKKLFQSWIASVNYVRNVSAHHARLFNRKLVVAPKRPRGNAVPMLEHLGAQGAPKEFGVYSNLAVMAYLLRGIHPTGDWPSRVAEHLRNFPSNDHINLGSMGIADGWLAEALWA